MLLLAAAASASHPHALEARKGPQGPQSPQGPQGLDGPQLRVSQDVGCQGHQRHLEDTEGRTVVTASLQTTLTVVDWIDWSTEVDDYIMSYYIVFNKSYH